MPVTNWIDHGDYGHDEDGQDSSIELPRHIPLDAFDEFSNDSKYGRDTHERDVGGRDMFSQRDDTVGHGDSLSTAAHHVSGLTFSAGLAPRMGSLPNSDCEFDPDRPLQGILNIPTDFSVFNITRTPKSARESGKPSPARPAVLQPDAQLDKVVRSGRFRSHPRETDDAVSDVSTVARKSDIENAPTSPQLGDAFGRQAPAFSSKQPRRIPQNIITVMPASSSTPLYSARVPQPQLQQPQRTVSGTSRTASTATVRDEDDSPAHMQPLSAATSKFERLARGVASDLQRAKQDLLGGAPLKMPMLARTPFADIGNGGTKPTTPARPARAHTPGRSVNHHVRLPDVTGITNAVESPMRAGQAYYDADEESGLDEHQQQIPDPTHAIDDLAARLASLEDENNVARRRVRELEMELDECRADVARERTRVLDAEARERKEKAKGKARSTAAAAEQSAIFEARYKEAVEEKQNLEVIVRQLRAQLAAMTRELENSQAVIRELRQFRERDAEDMRLKLAEIDDLRGEVDRLADEVEHLRGTIEDGLRERDRRRDSGSDTATMRPSPSPPREFEPAGLSAVVEEPTNEMQEEEEELRRRARERPPSRMSRHAPARNTRERSPDAEWMHPTGYATVGSERPARFVENDELSRIEEELSMRRLERSSSRFGSHQTASPQPSRPQSPALPERVGKRQDSRTTKAPMPDLSSRGERLQRMFEHAPEHNEHTCTICHRRKKCGGGESTRHHSAPPDVPEHWSKGAGVGQVPVDVAAAMAGGPLPPQSVLARVLHELEADFTHYKGLYSDLADQYNLMDAASNVVKRNVVAEQLKEVIDLLERKGDHIAALHDLLKVRDKPLAEYGWTIGDGDRLRARRR